MDDDARENALIGIRLGRFRFLWSRFGQPRGQRIALIGQLQEHLGDPATLMQRRMFTAALSPFLRAVTTQHKQLRAMALEISRRSPALDPALTAAALTAAVEKEDAKWGQHVLPLTRDAGVATVRIWEAEFLRGSATN